MTGGNEFATSSSWASVPGSCSTKHPISKSLTNMLIGHSVLNRRKELKELIQWAGIRTSEESFFNYELDYYLISAHRLMLKNYIDSQKSANCKKLCSIFGNVKIQFNISRLARHESSICEFNQRLFRSRLSKEKSLCSTMCASENDEKH